MCVLLHVYSRAHTHVGAIFDDSVAMFACNFVPVDTLSILIENADELVQLRNNLPRVVYELEFVASIIVGVLVSIK